MRLQEASQRDYDTMYIEGRDGFASVDTNHDDIATPEEMLVKIDQNVIDQLMNFLGVQQGESVTWE